MNLISFFSRALGTLAYFEVGILILRSKITKRLLSVCFSYLWSEYRDKHTLSASSICFSSVLNVNLKEYKAEKNHLSWQFGKDDQWSMGRDGICWCDRLCVYVCVLFTYLYGFFFKYKGTFNSEALFTLSVIICM